MISEKYKRHDGEEYDAYYVRLSGVSYRAGEAVKIHETWKRRLMMGSGVREVDCHQRIFVVLRELLKSDFLRNDYIDTGVPKDDCHRALKELKALHFEDLMQMEGADWKYALLSQQLRHPAESRVLIDASRAGFYIDEMQEKLSDEALETFFWFATLTQLAYQDLDALMQESDMEAAGQDTHLTPEQQAVRNFINNIIQVANKAHDRWNGKMVVPAVHQAEVEIVIKQDELKKFLHEKEKNDIGALAKWCFPETAKSKPLFCQYVRQLQQLGYFGHLPNKMLAEAIFPVLKLRVGTVANYLSKT